MFSKERETPRLNMEHGFMQSIIKNQVDRDEYDKEQKCLKVQSKISSSSRRERPRRADIQVYVPPHLRQKEALKEKTAANTRSTSTSSKASTTEDWEAEEKPAFPAGELAIQMKLEFVRQDGKMCELDIREGEDLKKLVSSFGKANGLDARLRDALYHRLSSAMNSMKGRAV